MLQHGDEKVFYSLKSVHSYIKKPGLLFVLSVTGGLGCKYLSAGVESSACKWFQQ